jgi:hypothetical protein
MGEMLQNPQPKVLNNRPEKCESYSLKQRKGTPQPQHQSHLTDYLCNSLRPKRTKLAEYLSVR